MKRQFYFFVWFIMTTTTLYAQDKPNVILIYADDLGYGDVGIYGATEIETPNLDRLAKQGVRFTNGHATSSTCTPSRFALMTGTYPWRQTGTGVLPGNAALIVPTDKVTLPKVFKQAGYHTAMVGKWHLGLGDQVEKDWNSDIMPGPNEVGFDYSFIFPATADRVPTVFMENHRVIGLDPDDPINVNYRQRVGNDPTGKENPELLKMKSSHGHDQTIVNGIGRIGYMEGGHRARWVDEEITPTFLSISQEFISKNRDHPFFLVVSLNEPHVPRMPSTMFKGKSKLGYRGDAIMQLDWTVGQIMEQLESLNLLENTLIVFTSDNGPVLDDGYEDGAATLNGVHTPAGPLRGGKYSLFEAGTRVPFIVSWPKAIKPGSSDALVSQVDLVASFAAMLGQNLPDSEAIDSENVWAAISGNSKVGRNTLVKNSNSNALALISGHWKYIAPNNGSKYSKLVGIELGNDSVPQLYNLNNDIGELNNLAQDMPGKVKELQLLLDAIQARPTREINKIMD